MAALYSSPRQVIKRGMEPATKLVGAGADVIATGTRAQHIAGSILDVSSGSHWASGFDPTSSVDVDLAFGVSKAMEMGCNPQWIPVVVLHFARCCLGMAGQDEYETPIYTLCAHFLNDLCYVSDYDLRVAGMSLIEARVLLSSLSTGWFDWGTFSAAASVDANMPQEKEVEAMASLNSWSFLGLQQLQANFDHRARLAVTSRTRGIHSQ